MISPDIIQLPTSSMLISLSCIRSRQCADHFIFTVQYKLGIISIFMLLHLLFENRGCSFLHIALFAANRNAFSIVGIISGEYFLFAPYRRQTIHYILCIFIILIFIAKNKIKMRFPILGLKDLLREFDNESAELLKNLEFAILAKIILKTQKGKMEFTV